MAREFNRAHNLAAVDSKLPENDDFSMRRG
jgi:hypothetical protein